MSPSLCRAGAHGPRWQHALWVSRAFERGGAPPAVHSNPDPHHRDCAPNCQPPVGRGLATTGTTGRQRPDDASLPFAVRAAMIVSMFPSARSRRAPSGATGARPWAVGRAPSRRDLGIDRPVDDESRRDPARAAPWWASSGRCPDLPVKLPEPPGPVGQRVDHEDGLADLATATNDAHRVCTRRGLKDPRAEARPPGHPRPPYRARRPLSSLLGHGCHAGPSPGHEGTGPPCDDTHGGRPVSAECGERDHWLLFRDARVASVEAILTKVGRCRAVLETAHESLPTSRERGHRRRPHSRCLCRARWR